MTAGRPGAENAGPASARSRPAPRASRARSEAPLPAGKQEPQADASQVMNPMQAAGLGPLHLGISGSRLEGPPLPLWTLLRGTSRRPSGSLPSRRARQTRDRGPRFSSPGRDADSGEARPSRRQSGKPARPEGRASPAGSASSEEECQDDLRCGPASECPSTLARRCQGSSFDDSPRLRLGRRRSDGSGLPLVSVPCCLESGDCGRKCCPEGCARGEAGCLTSILFCYKHLGETRLQNYGLCVCVCACHVVNEANYLLY